MIRDPKIAEGWWKDPQTVGCPGEYEIPPELRHFLLLQNTIWLVTGLSCKFFEERRKDYIEMMIHHCITCWLIITAIQHGEHGFALLTLVVHDISDVWIDILKMSNYMKMEERHGYFW